MSIFKVYISPDQADVDNPDDPQIVADKFYWIAMLIPPFWALAHRLWLVCAAWGVATVILVVLATYIGGEPAFWLYLLGVTALGFEASSLRGAKLTARGRVHHIDLVANDVDLATLEWQKLRQAQSGVAG